MNIPNHKNYPEIKKASILYVPCYFNEYTKEVTPRYGWINDKLLDLVVSFWVVFGELFTDEEGFPVVIYEDNIE